MYGSGRKKLSVRADTTAGTRAAERPPSSATTIVKAMKTKARFDAEVSERSGISMRPSARPPSAPATIHKRLSSPGFMAVRRLLAVQRQIEVQDADPSVSEDAEEPALRMLLDDLPDGL